MTRFCLASGALALSFAGVATAQVVNPAEAHPGAQSEPKPAERLRTFEMPPLEVFGKAPLREEDRIGSYAQPRWTADRLFSETRVYVIPKGKVDFEYWLVPEISRDGSTDIKTMYEIEFGLPGRFQIDLYMVGHKTDLSGPLVFGEQKAEVRWAFADWGKIPGNPTVYVEWKGKDSAADHLEAKLLLGGQIRTGWHWGSNFVWEEELGGPRERGREWTVGVSHTVRDSAFDLGVETQLALINERDAAGRRGEFTTAFLVGPSFQFRPLPQMHIDLAPLFGTNHDSARSKIFVVLGYEF